MLNNIKSSYFSEMLFSLLNEKVKLKFVKYNKIFQHNLGIQLINYKLFSTRFIIYESNKKGKEYNSLNGNLIYEGEYLKGERSGYGKEYNFYMLIFEGKYLNGKRNGKGKEYYYNSKLRFEGDYLNGEKWNGKGYDENGNIIYELINGNGKIIEYNLDFEKEFEGEFINGKRNGQVKEYKYGYLIFEGKYLNGLRNGKGKEYFDGELIFEGEYLNGKRWNGRGYNGENNIIYELKNGTGYIKEYMFKDLIFEGQFLNGEKNGKGKEYSNCKLKFEGEYLNGKRKGKGIEYYDDEIKFIGEYLYDYRKKGKTYTKRKLEFDGDYLFDKKWNGKGYDENGNISYELINGTGKVKEYNYWNDLIQFEGEYLNGKKI